MESSIVVNEEAIRIQLDNAYARFASLDFIEHDPVSIPHKFSKKEDIEISGFLTAIIAWGQRVTIIKNASRLMELMDNAPHDFIRNHFPKDRLRFKGFVHRTFSEVDVMYFMEALQRIYLEHGGLESAFASGLDALERLSAFHQLFFDHEHLARTKKHVSNPRKGSSAKRLNMYLRWMVRPAKEGVDFGLWSRISPSELMIPLDIHTSTVGRSLGLLTRKQNDWKSVEELTSSLRRFDANDPVKYDFALFGLGVTKSAR